MALQWRSTFRHVLPLQKLELNELQKLELNDSKVGTERSKVGTEPSTKWVKKINPSGVVSSQSFIYLHICCVEKLKFLFMWRYFRFFHICHVLKSEISPHDRFFSTYIQVMEVTNIRYVERFLFFKVFLIFTSLKNALPSF